jgi:hypothetical protein
MGGRSGQQCSISNPELRPRDVAAKDRQLVPEHQQFDVLQIQAAAAPNKRSQQSPQATTTTYRQETSKGDLQQTGTPTLPPPNQFVVPHPIEFLHPTGYLLTAE